MKRTSKGDRRTPPVRDWKRRALALRAIDSQIEKAAHRLFDLRREREIIFDHPPPCQ